MSNNCKESTIWDITLDPDPSLSWKAWIFQHERPKHIVVSKSFHESLDELREDCAKFKFVKNVQSEYFQNAIQNLTNEKAIVQIDFADQSLISQDEIHSAHWSRFSRAAFELSTNYIQRSWDNCATQFKNRYVIASVNELKIEQGFTHLV